MRTAISHVVFEQLESCVTVRAVDVKALCAMRVECVTTCSITLVNRKNGKYEKRQTHVLYLEFSRTRAAFCQNNDAVLAC